MQAVHDNPRPTFKDLNAVAAHALASILLPARTRGVASPAPSADATVAGYDSRTPRSAMRHSPGAPLSGTRPRLSPGMHAAHANTAATLAHLPEQLGRTVAMADMLKQVRSLCFVGSRSCCQHADALLDCLSARSAASFHPVGYACILLLPCG